LTSASQHTRKDFQIIIAFGHSAFITSQLMFVLRNMVLKRYLACRTFRKCQPHVQQWELFYAYVHKLLKSKLTISCTTSSVERCLSKMAVL